MAVKDFQQCDWNAAIEADCRAIVRLAVDEDLGGQQDWTTTALVPADRMGAAAIVTREAGVVAGVPVINVVIEEMSAQIQTELNVTDGQHVESGTALAVLHGKVCDLLTVERTLLNLLARLMGVATMASRYVAEVEGTQAKVYDTRKTTPGWRRLEKYAVHCGGAQNHRMGLYDAVLIKDNHLAQRAAATRDDATNDVAGAVLEARQFLHDNYSPNDLQQLIVEIEVDTLEQLRSVLPADPDIVLLDNMSVSELQHAVQLRNELAPKVQLEASGGVNLQTLREIALTGVERISVGALTHSVRSLDIGLDWQRR